MSERVLRACKFAFVAQIQPNKFYNFKINEEISTFRVASNSVFLSTAAYIVKEFPNLPHPKMTNCVLPEIKKDGELGWRYLSVHPLFDDWVEILENTLKEGNAKRLNQTLYLKINVTAEYCSYLKELPFEFSETEFEQSVEKIFGIEVLSCSKKIAFLNMSKSQIDRKVFEPYVNSYAILFGQIYNNETIEFFNILQNEIPSVDKILEFDTVIIPGSGLSVLGDNEEVEKARVNLIEAYRKSETLKILGICFGHQLIAKSFGAKLVKRERCKGIHSIKFYKDVIEKFDFLSPLRPFDNPQFDLSEHHEDFVTTLPEGFLKLGDSQVAENEGFVSENGRILTFQFHSEYCYPYTKGYISRVSVYQGGAIEDELSYGHDEKTISEHIKSSELLRECMMNFI